MATETERLERETEATRAQLEQTLGELRARISPGQLFDQATDYLRNSSGRTYLHNLRDEVVHNPVPVTLIGAGIAWLAISGVLTRRAGHDGRVAVGLNGGGAADNLDFAHGRRGPSPVQRAKETAAGWAHETGEAIAETEERWHDRAEHVGERVSTAYDETVDRARQAAEGWTDEVRSAAASTRETLHDGIEGARELAGDLYEKTADGFRRVTRKASDYGHAARDAVRPDGALVNFCREQPLLVAGLGIALGAALAAMIPASRVERQAMGEASRKVQDRIKETATDTWHSVSAAGGAQGTNGLGENDLGENDQGENDQGAGRDDRPGQPANDSDTATYRSDAGRSEQPAYATRRESWQSDAMGSREAAAEVERGVRQGERASSIETEPSRATNTQAAEAGASSTVPGEETKQRT
jgi:hypothetical protein